MFNSIIQNISKPFYRKDSKQTNNYSESGTTVGRGDRVEDGFLLVGDTASERTIVNARDFNAESVDAPPNYGEVSRNCLPSYQEFSSGTFGQSPTLDVSHFPGIQHGSPFSTGSPTVVTGRQANELQQNSTSTQGFPDGRAGITALSDVPFVLRNGLQFSTSIQEIHSSGIFQQKSFDYSLYDYNFNLERSFLNEHEEYRENEGMEISY